MAMLQAEKIMSSDDKKYQDLMSSLQVLVKPISQLPQFLHTLYLFTKNDFLTFAIPTTLFALFGSLSGSLLTTNTSPQLHRILLRIPTALLVVWSNLLIFNISNQRSPSAVEEDKINKPHRPLPSGRITTESSRRLLLVGVPVVLVIGWILGCWQETLLLFTATWMYNDLGGCDEDWILRNFLIALGYGLYSSAALRVMVGSEHQITPTGFQWVALVTLVMFTTQHICDIKDAEGDRTRGRRSAPIVLGDDAVRWSVAVPVLLSSVACPAFFGLGLISYGLTMGTGSIVAGRTLMMRDLRSDKLTWKLWALWTCGLFALPLTANSAAILKTYEALRGIVCFGGECEGALNLAAVSGVAVVVQGRRFYKLGGWENSTVNETVPRIVVEGVVV